MKERNDWLGQEKLDAELDRLVDAGTITVDSPNIYKAAKELYAKPSGSFYQKARDWQKRRQADLAGPMLQVSPAVEAEFKAILDDFVAQAMASFLATLGRVGGEIDRSATLRVTDAQQRLARADSEIDRLAGEWARCEGDLQLALDRIHLIEERLGDAKRDAERLTGRLEEQSKLLDLRTLSGAKSSEKQPDAAVEADAEQATVLDRESEPESPVVPGERSACEHVEGGVKTQPLASESDLPPAGPRELPLVSKEKADEA